MKCIFSIDVEDWFHILDTPSTPKISEWSSLPSIVEKNFIKLLDILSAKNIYATCFFLGWIAEKMPGLVKEASNRGHEIASHGYSHRLVYEMTEQEFFQDILISKDIIENIIGHSVLGYRSAGFSVTEETPWFFDKLIEAGYRYDTSVFPASREHGGLKSNTYKPYAVGKKSKEIIEFPITIAEILGKRLCFFGGGYLRFFPYFLIKKMTSNVLKENRPVIFYVHPREIDPDHPRLPMSMRRRFKSYVNIKTTEQKIIKLLDEFEFATFEKFMNNNINLIKG